MFVLGEINYFLIIGGWALFIGSIYNYKGYNSIIEFSMARIGEDMRSGIAISDSVYFISSHNGGKPGIGDSMLF